MAGDRIIRGIIAGAATVFVSLFASGSLAQASDFTVTNLAGDNSAGSLHAAMDAANANPSDKDSITFQAGLVGAISLVDDLPELTGPVEINGPGSSKLSIGRDPVNYPFHAFRTSKDLTLTGMTVVDGVDPGNGGTISSTGGDLVLKDVTVTRSRAYYGKGGALYVDGGSLTIEDSTFYDNTAVTGAGAWISNADSVSISNSSFSNNKARYFFAGPHPDPNTGGGLRIEDTAKVEINGSVIQANTADTDGAAFSINNAGEVTLADTFVANNEMAFIESPPGYDYFGTARIIADQTTITGSQFIGNASGSILAGLQIIGAAKISGSVIANNVTGGPYSGLILGGDVEHADTNNVTATVSNTTITGNQGGSLGSGLISTVSKLNLNSSTISGNTLLFPVFPTANSAGLLQVYGTATLTSSIVSGNDPADISAIGTIPQSPVPNKNWGGYVQGSYNLIGTANGRKYKELVAGSDIHSIDPKLGALAYFEDATTQTMMPLADSPVIDQGKSSSTTDQIGKKRPVNLWTPNAKGGNGADIGAVELQTSGTKPSNNFTLGKVKVNRKKGTATVQVKFKVPADGTVLLAGSKTVKKASKKATGGASLTLAVKPTGKALKTLKKKGKVTVKAKVKFTPIGGKPMTKTKTVKLFMAKKKK